MSVIHSINRQIVLKSRPEGSPSLDNFELRETSVPQPREGEVLIRTLYLSLERRRSADGVAGAQRLRPAPRLRAHCAIQCGEADGRSRHVFGLAQAPPPAGVHRLGLQCEAS